MTEFDKILLKKAEGISRWKRHQIDVLIDIADTQEAREELQEIQHTLYELALESL